MPILIFFSSGFAIMAPGSGISAAERQRIRRQIRDADPQKRADCLRKKKICRRQSQGQNKINQRPEADRTKNSQKKVATTEAGAAKGPERDCTSRDDTATIP